MGLLQKACETYDNMAHLAGEYIEGQEPLAPVSHSITSASAAVIEVTIDADGNFRMASAIGKDESKTIYPVTEESAGRSGTKAYQHPHPLCDQIKYLTPPAEENYYIPQLEAWCKSKHTHPKLIPILEYVKKGTIGSDLTDTFRNDKKTIASLENGDAFIRWRIVGLGDDSGPCRTDKSLFDSYMDYYASLKQSGNENLCMISGDVLPLAVQHPKGIIPVSGNAKLISANDSVNFTYRGRFKKEDQAATVSYDASQKAHNALKWLAAQSGVSIIYGGRTFICWNPKGKSLPSSVGPFKSKDAKRTAEPTEYKKQLLEALLSYKNDLPEGEDVIIASFDAATTGRLALTYYNELQASDYLDRLQYWDETCCLKHRYYGIISPSLPKIVRCAFGTEREKAGKKIIEVDDKLMRQQLQALLNCRIEKAHIPLSVMHALVQKASRPLAYNEPKNREEVLFTACAVIRKYLIDNNPKEEWSMAYDYTKADRDYQFGGLLALLEDAERKTYRDDETRETNAIRMQSVFSKRPMYAAKIVWEKVKNSYYPHLTVGTRIFYERKIGAIWEILNTFDTASLNDPLKETYLLGYYLMRNELWKSRSNNKNTEEDEDEYTEE